MAGVTATETRVGEVTVKVPLPEIPENVAVIVELPIAAHLARPALVIVALVVLELQLAEAVRLLVLPSV